MTYRGRLRLKGVPFFRFQVYERVVISLVKVYAGKGREISHFSRHKGGSKGLTDTFYGFDEEKKRSGFVRFVKEVPFVNRRYTKGVLFCQKWYVKSQGVGPRGGASPYKTF